MFIIVHVLDCDVATVFLYLDLSQFIRVDVNYFCSLSFLLLLFRRFNATMLPSLTVTGLHMNTHDNVLKNSYSSVRYSNLFALVLYWTAT